MTTKVSVDGLNEIAAEHRALDRQYTMFQTLLDDDGTQLPTLRARLTNLATVLECHFEHEEDGGYFTDIIEASPELGQRARDLESEHEQLLTRFQQIGDRLSVPFKVATAFTALKQEIRALIAVCRAHEHLENELAQDACLREIGEEE
ncbi:MAG: hemerythrin domain-containing protein [Planctomycetaceae bacterium]|jgi:iron-sulfur cluster repair protein YtfE (RIC family)